jgi:tRNA (guanine-N7-)-methyltransferase
MSKIEDINVSDELDLDEEDDNDDDVEIVEEVQVGKISKKRLKVKVRQHVNPLAAQHQIPIKLSDNWIQESFANPTLPFIIDIGCAKGGWPLSYAKAFPNTNILGLEIRRPCVEYSLRRKAFWQLTNVHFLSLNANVDLDRIFSDIRKTSDVDMVLIQFPDPHFKAKHKKRRVVNDELVECIGKNLAPSKKLFIQTDIKEMAEHMVESFSANAKFAAVDAYSTTDLTANANPTPILTERETATLKKGDPVYRMLYSVVLG